MNKIYLVTNGKETIAFFDYSGVMSFFEILEEEDAVDRYLYRYEEIKIYKDDAMQAYADMRNEDAL